MQDRTGTDSNSGQPGEPIVVSPNNPCPFLRAVVSEGFVGGHTVPLRTLSQTVQAASGKTGFEKAKVGIATRLVALIANSLSPLRLLKSWWSGAALDELRNGPLDKHGVGSRILDASAHVHEDEIERLANFGKDRPDPMGGGIERGLTSGEITTYMDANFERAGGTGAPIDRKLMEGEWPVLLRIMGKGEGEARYLSVAEVRTLFTERRLPERINARLSAHPVHSTGLVGKLAQGRRRAHRAARSLLVVFAEFPELIRPIPMIGQLVTAGLAQAPTVESGLLARPELVDGRPVLVSPCKPGHGDFPGALHLVHRAGAAAAFVCSAGPACCGQRLSRTLRIHSESQNRPHRCERPCAALALSIRPTPRPSRRRIRGRPEATAGGQSRRPARRLFAHDQCRNPGTGAADSDKIGLTCAACHTGSIYYKGTSVRFDGGDPCWNCASSKLRPAFRSSTP